VLTLIGSVQFQITEIDVEKKTEEDIITDDEIHLLDYLIVLAKRKRLIIGFTLCAALITAVVSLIMSPVYKAETTLLPPQESEQGMRAQLMNKFEDLPGFDRGGISGKFLFIDIIKSRTVFDGIIERFDLMNLYEAEYKEDVRRILANNVTVKSDKQSSLITVAVLNRDPKLAADMANAFVDELKKLVHNLAITKASQRRLFFEEQLKESKEALLESEESMQEFQEETGVMKVEEQAKAVIESIANMRAQIAAKEVELKVMKTYTTANNPDLQRVEETLKGLKIELAKLEEKEGVNPDPLMPTGRMPVVGADYVRKLRDLKFNETLFELMAKQYEMARIEEAKDAAIVQVIDKAVVPEKKFKPARRQMVTIATLTALFFSIFLAFFMEYAGRASAGTENLERLDALKKYLSFKR
jgi:uncharacterized protein involved in exopolysaccharide biosynthesis